MTAWPATLAACRAERAAVAHHAILTFPGAAGIHADARRDLRALATVIINEPGAWEQVESLARDWEPQGALVFACLLDLSGRHHSATWWWQFAAGAGSHLAAYRMYLHHLRGELRAADSWFHPADCMEDGTSAPIAPKFPNLLGYARLASRLAPPLPDPAGLPRPDRALRVLLGHPRPLHPLTAECWEPGPGGRSRRHNGGHARCNGKPPGRRRRKPGDRAAVVRDRRGCQSAATT